VKECPLKALITGISGFVGSHLAGYLLAHTDWQVAGTVYGPYHNILPLRDQLELYPAELSRLPVVEFVLDLARPDVIFHLAAMAVTGKSWRDPAATLQVNAGMQANILQAVVDLELDCRVLVVGSSEEYGAVPADRLPIGEQTPFRPLNPYAVSKVAQDMLGLQYHLSHGLDVVRVRPFNHIGPRQGLGFVVPDFASQVARIEAGQQEAVMRVGNLEARRDFTGSQARCTTWGQGRRMPSRKCWTALWPAAPCRSRWSPIRRACDPATFRWFCATMAGSMPARVGGQRFLLNKASPTCSITGAPRCEKRKRSERMPTALITGVTGQDGSYLAEFLLSRGYEVVGMVRRSSTVNFQRIEHIQDQIALVPGDLLDQMSLVDALREYRPHQVYNLAAQSFVPTSWRQPVFTGEVTALGVTRMLDAIRIVDPGIRFYQASSSEMFGKVREVPQNEHTPFYPRSPYGVAKVYGHWITINYRESYDLFACSGILFNHESPRRGLEFVTRKVTYGAARIKLGLADDLHLGNLESRRDWGYAGDYVRAMWLMLQQDHPDDYVVGTGATHAVRELCEVAFDHLGLDWTRYVVVDPQFYRPAEVDLLVSDPGKAKRALGWEPEVDFEALIRMMVDADLKQLKEESGL
jgi:GDPmannose 4,6-dehydratase